MDEITAAAGPPEQRSAVRVHAAALRSALPRRSVTMSVMSTPRRTSFPITVTHLPVVRCQICDRTVPHRPGEVGQALTEHYRRTHPELLGQQ